MSQISATSLSKRELLSEKPDSIHLNGQHIRLEPLIIERDAKTLFEMSNGKSIHLANRCMEAYDDDELIWRYMLNGPFENMDQFVANLEPQVHAPNGLCLCVFDVATERQIGVTNLMNNFSSHLKIELGGIWYSPIAQKTFANMEAAYLMLKHCFELGYRRVEWKCHTLNERSRKAALRIGFKFEGIHENHLIVKNCNRDTAWFRILDREWPDIKQYLENILYQSG